MRLIVETGQSLPDANSYIDVADIEKYLSSNVLAEYNKLSADEKIDRLIIASLFVDYSFNWNGQQKTLEQGLCWPRINVFFQGHTIPDDYIPKQLKRACSMAVNLIMEFGSNVFQETGELQVKKEKLGQIETEYFEAIKIAYNNNSRYTDINNILRGLYYKSSGVTTARILRK